MWGRRRTPPLYAFMGEESMQVKDDGPLGSGFDPDKFWGPGNWVEHVGCPLGRIFREKSVTHAKNFHGRPLKAEPKNASS